MLDNHKAAEDIYVIDANLFSFPKYGAVYLLAEQEMTLIEAGCASSAASVLRNIRKLGFDPKDIRNIVVTHIHLDHAGATGILLKEMPQARVIVHKKGAKHLIDPSRIENSLKSFSGDDLLKLYGKSIPVESKRVLPVEDGDIIQLSPNQQLRIIYTPGHAPHHMCIYESKNNGLFTGDAVGIYLSYEDALIPTTPPPDIDLEVYVNTINSLKEIRPDILYFSHFGETRQVNSVLERSADTFKTWGDIISNALKRGDKQLAIQELQAHAADDLKHINDRLLFDYNINHFVPMCALGLIKYYQEKQ